MVKTQLRYRLVNQSMTPLLAPSQERIDSRLTKKKGGRENQQCLEFVAAEDRDIKTYADRMLKVYHCYISPCVRGEQV